MLSAPSVHVPYSQVSAPEAAQSTGVCWWWRRSMGGGRGWGSIELTWVRALPGCWQGRGQHRGRGATVGFFFCHHSTMQLYCMAVQPSDTTSPFIQLLAPCVSCRMSPHGPQQSSAWVCSPDATFQHPALFCSSGHSLRLGGHGRGQYPVYRSHSVLLPQTVGVFSSHREWGSPSVSSGLTPPVRSFPGCGDLSSLQIPPGFAGPTPLPFLFLFLLLSLVLPVKAGIFLDLFFVYGLCSPGALKILPFLMYSCCVCGERWTISAWSSGILILCLYFIFKQAKDSSFFSKSLTIFTENIR